jgi:hypothetical protein
MVEYAKLFEDFSELAGHQKIELFLSARSLKNKDTFSKSDPFAVIKLQNV